jgi:hypothetical protein
LYQLVLCLAFKNVPCVSFCLYNFLLTHENFCFFHISKQSILFLSIELHSVRTPEILYSVLSPFYFHLYASFSVSTRNNILFPPEAQRSVPSDHTLCSHLMHIRRSHLNYYFLFPLKHNILVQPEAQHSDFHFKHNVLSLLSITLC